MKAYLTTEAACIMPLIIGVCTFVIYAMLYHYDRCLLEQDVILALIKEEEPAFCGSAVLEGVCFAEENTLTGRKIRACGQLKVPFAELFGGKMEEMWKVETEWKINRIDPTEWIRLYRKVLEESENASD